MEQAGDAQRWETVERIQVRFAAMVLLPVLLSSMCVAAEHGGGLSGTVRDEHGVPQMGAVIELIGTARGDVRTAVTGLDGQYVFDHLLTGTYRVRASASFFRPVSTRGLHVGGGVQAVVNLTLANIYSAAALLPAERKQSDEASDEWVWTMRSAASRPVLRLAGGVSAGQAEGGSKTGAVTPVAVGSAYTSGSFGAGGAGEMVAAGFRSADGTQEGTGVVRYGGVRGEVSVHVAAERHSSPWSSLSTAVAFESDPAIRPVGGGDGWRSMRIASAEVANLGDTATVEIGSMLATDVSQPGMPASRPFGRVRVFVPGAWTLEYAMATDRSLQRAADAGGTVGTLRSGMGDGHGVSRIEHGRHQAVSLSRRSETRTLEVSYYRDGLGRTPVLGSRTAAGLQGASQGTGLTPGALVDGTNGTFRAEGPGYTTEGCRVTISQRMTPGTWVELRFADGAALEIPEAGSPAEQGSLTKIRVGRGVTAGVTAHSRVRRTGTVARASYQWQPERMITPIDAFDAVGVPAYLGFAVQQDVPARLAPRGTVVRVSANNVLRQGLRSVLAGDQSVATLAQELPTMQAGIGFTF